MKRLILNMLRHFGYDLQKNSTNSLDAFSTQRELIKVKEAVIFDVGAHIGSVAMKYRTLFPFASIYCFEPFPQSFEILMKNVGGDTRVSCYKVAISGKNGTAVLNANLSPATNSLLRTDKKGSVYWGEGLLDTKYQVEVDTTTMDCFVKENGLTNIDILKLDVQGAEFDVLKGARDTLSQHKISLIYTELILCPTYEGLHKLHEYLALFDFLGYELLDFFNPLRRHRQLIQADAVFLSSSFKEASKDLLITNTKQTNAAVG